jgi:hypothetical protein
MAGCRESASSIVPPTRPNPVRCRAPTHTAAAGEGRERAKGQAVEHTRGRRQRRRAWRQALARLRQAARRRPRPVTALGPQGDEVDRLRAAEAGLTQAAAPGVAGQPGTASGEAVEAHRRDLADRLKRGA